MMTAMVDGVPVSYEVKDGVRRVCDGKRLAELPEDVRDGLFRWIDERIVARKTPNNAHTSYGLKHVFSRDMGAYVSNDQFKEAMLACGHRPVDENELNWVFCISQRPPALADKARRPRGWFAAEEEGVEGR